MFRPEIRGVPEEHVADSAGNSGVESLVGRKPIGTCKYMSEDKVRITIGHLHPIGSVGQRLDDQILIIVSPFAHPRV